MAFFFFSFFVTRLLLELKITTIPFSFVERSVSHKSNFVRFLCEILNDKQIAIGENYALGATKTSEVIFWQIDMQGKVRTGKIMQYNPDTGRRLKHESGAIETVSKMLGHTNIKTTQIYARITDSKISNDMQALAGKLQGIEKMFSI